MADIPVPEDPEELVGKWIHVDGKGVGYVQEINKVMCCGKHTHTVNFATTGPEEVVLRRESAPDGLPFEMRRDPDEESSGAGAVVLSPPPPPSSFEVEASAVVGPGAVYEGCAHVAPLVVLMC